MFSNRQSQYLRFLVIPILLLSGAAVASSPCGPKPIRTPVCAVWVCSIDQFGGAWEADPQPFGTACTTKAHGAGQCDGNGYCGYMQPVTFHGVPVSLLYTPPGKQSSVSYGTGSTTGSIFSQSYMQGQSTSAQGGFSILGNGVSASQQWTNGVVNGTSLSTTKVSSTTVTASNPGTGSDSPDHQNDQLFMWTNPASTLFINESLGTIIGQYWSTSDGASQNIVPFTIGQLQGTQTITNVYMKAIYNTFTNTDKANFLTLDPYASTSTPYLDPKRFQKVSSGQTFWGPACNTCNIDSWNFTYAYNTQNNSTYGTYVNSQTTVVVKIGLDLGFVNIGGQTNYVATQNYQETRQNISGNQQTTSATLRTPTVQCAITTDVYIDAAFGTYLVVPTSTSGC